MSMSCDVMSRLKQHSDNDVIIFIGGVSIKKLTIRYHIERKISKKLNIMIRNEMRMYQSTLITLLR